MLKKLVNSISYIHGWFTVFKFLVNRVENFIQEELPSFKLRERIKMFCSNINIKPTPNSTADKTKKKNVKDKKFILSYDIPIDNTIR